jgi:hypothetical protein
VEKESAILLAPAEIRKSADFLLHRREADGWRRWREAPDEALS